MRDLGPTYRKSVESSANLTRIGLASTLFPGLFPSRDWDLPPPIPPHEEGKALVTRWVSTWSVSKQNGERQALGIETAVSWEASLVEPQKSLISRKHIFAFGRFRL